MSSGGFLGQLERPASNPITIGDVLPDGRILVEGWAFSADGAPLEVAARIGSGDRHRLIAERVRDDVYLDHPEIPSSGRSGFVGLVRVPPSETAAGPLVVEVRDGAGWRPLAERKFAPLDVGSLEADDDRDALPLGPLRDQPEGPNLRALLVSQNFNLEGAPRSLLELAGRLQAAGTRLRVLGPAPGGLTPLWHRLLPDRGGSMGYVGDPGRIDHLDDYAQRIRRLAVAEAPHRPDIVVANTLDSFWAIDLARALGIPSLWIVRESVDVESYFLGRWPYEIARRALLAFEHASQVNFVSHATEALYQSVVPSSRRGVIWNGLDLGKIDRLCASTSKRAARRKLALPQHVPLVLCVGTVCQRKGQHILLEALDRLSARASAPIGVMVGARESDYLTALRKRIVDSGLTGRISLIAEVEDPLLYYRAADVFACPSFEESLPRVVLEAMAFGLPTVASRIYGVPEMLDDASGWLVAPGDADALATAIAAMLDDPSAASAAGARARARLEADFSIERMGDRYVDTLRSLTAEVRD